MEKESPIEVSLVPLQKSFVPGQTITVGIYQKMEPKYHTYYKNPGKIGLPTAIHWDLPKGFEAGEILWPTPEEVPMSVYNTWGYEDEVLLAIELKTPANLPLGEDMDLKGRVVYMCCYKTCHPGSQQVKLTLKTAQTEVLEAQYQSLFDKVYQEQPIQDHQKKLSYTLKDRELKISISPIDNLPHEKISQVRFYDDMRLIDSNVPPKVRLSQNRLELVYKSEILMGKKPEHFSGLLVLPDPNLKTLRFKVPF